ncbi:hypothetical protein KKF38_00710 [Patescibacteria group bacterium]|nr:hypothetical protein [Patescibacteria group bacterium]
MNLEEYVFLSMNEEMTIKNFNPKLWTITVVDNGGVAEIEGRKIKAVRKGEMQVKFEKTEDDSCFFDVKIAVANVDSDSKSEKLKEEITIDLQNAQIDGSIPPLPPSEDVSQ